MLSGSLPIEVTRSNLEATKEVGEEVATFAAGDSVWFEWQATNTELVTIGSCDSDLRTVLGVFTGTEVSGLTRVVSGNPSEGPDCPYSQRQYTFEAISGTTYVIGIDGNAFFLPEAPKPVTEGTFALRIEATPAPVNDAFASATSIVTSFQEEFEGEAFYFGSVFGHNWNATEESGEPDHIGGPNGASVWYSWTVPVSGEAQISISLSPDLRLSVYSGDSLEALQLDFGGIGPSGWVTFSAQAGSTYRLAVYGLLDGPSGNAAMSSFQINVSMLAPVASPGGGERTTPPPPPDIVAPQTTISKRTVKPAKRRATFAFRSDEAGSSFRCKLDRRAFVACGSPKIYKGLGAGKHTFKVVAVDAAGNVDPTPAVARFSIPRRKR